MTRHWLHVIVGYGCRYKAGVAFVQHHLVLGGADLDVAGALEAHGDDEGVVLDKVAMQALVDVNYTHVEVWAVNDFAGSPPQPP